MNGPAIDPIVIDPTGDPVVDAKIVELTTERDLAVASLDVAVKEKEAVLVERDAAIVERDALAEARRVKLRHLVESGIEHDPEVRILDGYCQRCAALLQGLPFVE